VRLAALYLREISGMDLGDLGSESGFREYRVSPKSLSDLIYAEGVPGNGINNIQEFPCAYKITNSTELHRKGDIK